jgi:hypothetical protein
VEKTTSLILGLQMAAKPVVVAVAINENQVNAENQLDEVKVFTFKNLKHENKISIALTKKRRFFVNAIENAISIYKLWMSK